MTRSVIRSTTHMHWPVFYLQVCRRSVLALLLVRSEDEGDGREDACRDDGEGQVGGEAVAPYRVVVPVTELRGNAVIDSTIAQIRNLYC